MLASMHINPVKVATVSSYMSPVCVLCTSIHTVAPDVLLNQSSWTRLELAIGHWGGCTLHVDAMPYLVHCQHLACSLANRLYCSTFPYNKNAELPSAAVCQLISADQGIASQWTKLARLLGLSHSQIEMVRLECHNRPQLCQQSAAKVLSLWSTSGGTAHSSSLATLLRVLKHMDQHLVMSAVVQHLQRSSTS